jgi:hypothetical protein
MCRGAGLTLAAMTSPPPAPASPGSSRTDLNLKRIVGYGALAMMAAQLVVADAVFIFYCVGKGWGKLPEGSMQAWLAATVVQVIGVVLVIARSVFPSAGESSADAAPPSDSLG